MDKQKKLRVFYSDISALRDRSDQPQLWEFLCCARQQKIKQCKNEDDRLRAFGAGLLLEYGAAVWLHADNTCGIAYCSRVGADRTNTVFAAGKIRLW